MERPRHHETLDLLRALAGQLDEALIVVERDGTLVFASERARTLLQLDPGATAVPLAEWCPDYRLALLVEAVRTEQQPRRRDLDDAPHGRTLKARGFPLGDGSERIGVVLADRTRLRRLERVRRDFVANVSHELRTPIAAIQLLAETLQHGALSDQQRAAGFVDRIRLEAAHMTQMVEELLELSIVEAGARPARREAVGIAELLDSVDRLLPLAEQRGVALRIDVPAGLPRVTGDISQLGQLLRNLVHNALKFTPSGGSVTLRASRRGGAVAIEVIDTGMGITPEDLPRIFERFWKADRSRRRGGEGSGLGLAIARHVAQAHGGSITVRSTPGAGTTFTVELPVEPEPGAGTTFTVELPVEPETAPAPPPSGPSSTPAPLPDRTAPARLQGSGEPDRL